MIDTQQALDDMKTFYERYSLSRGAGARDKDGRGVQIESDTAVAFCPDGAARRLWPDDKETRGKVMSALAWSVERDVAYYADYEITNQVELFAWFEKAKEWDLRQTAH